MSAPMPAIFIGHGSPMNAVEDNAYTKAWKGIGKRLPRPRAVLAVSAHWYFAATAVTAMRQPRTIHDFYGFPDELFAFDYPAAGDPVLADAIVEIAKPTWVGLDRDQWGIDHGTWSVLAHLIPDASVPVIELSLNAVQGAEYHVALGRSLSKLREADVLVLCSGNVVHNLRAIDWSKPNSGFDWAERFDDAAREVLTNAPDFVLQLEEHRDFAQAVPTPEHFLPLLYLAGMAVETGEPIAQLLRGFCFGSLSMSCYGLGLDT